MSSGFKYLSSMRVSFLLGLSVFISMCAEQNSDRAVYTANPDAQDVQKCTPKLDGKGAGLSLFDFSFGGAANFPITLFGQVRKREVAEWSAGEFPDHMRLLTNQEIIKGGYGTNAKTYQERQMNAPVDFFRDVAPTILARCMPCHAPSNTSTILSRTTSAGIPQDNPAHIAFSANDLKILVQQVWNIAKFSPNIDENSAPAVEYRNKLRNYSRAIVAPIFDANYYLSNNGDLAAAGYTEATVINHWKRYGMAEGRRPSELIDIPKRLSDNPQLRQTVESAAQRYNTNVNIYALLEYLDSTPGPAILRDPDFVGVNGAPFFDAQYYFANNADVTRHSAYNTPEKAAEHWLTNGIDEGRKPSAKFDPIYYLLANSDINEVADQQLREKNIPKSRTAIRHYLMFGKNEPSRKLVPPVGQNPITPTPNPIPTSVTPSPSPVTTSSPTPTNSPLATQTPPVTTPTRSPIATATATATATNTPSANTQPSVVSPTAEQLLPHKLDVERVYLRILKRSSNEAEKNLYAPRLFAGTFTLLQLNDEIDNSNESIRVNMPGLWVQFLGRSPSEQDLQWYINEFRANPARLTMNQVRRQLGYKKAIKDVYVRNSLTTLPNAQLEGELVSRAEFNNWTDDQLANYIQRTHIGPIIASGSNISMSNGSNEIRSQALTRPASAQEVHPSINPAPSTEINEASSGCP